MGFSGQSLDRAGRTVISRICLNNCSSNVPIFRLHLFPKYSYLSCSYPKLGKMQVPCQGNFINFMNFVLCQADIVGLRGWIMKGNVPKRDKLSMTRCTRYQQWKKFALQQSNAGATKYFFFLICQVTLVCFSNTWWMRGRFGYKLWTKLIDKTYNYYVDTSSRWK